MLTDAERTFVASSTGTGRPRGRVIVMALFGLLVSGGALRFGWNAAFPAPDPPTLSVKQQPVAVAPTPIEPFVPQAETPDDAFRKLIVGKWETERSGRRVLTVQSDGTARMEVTVEGVWSYAVGSQIVLLINWKIENERVIFETTGGEPATSVDLLISIYGRHQDQPILTLDETTFRVPDHEAGEPDHIWKRISKTP